MGLYPQQYAFSPRRALQVLRRHMNQPLDYYCCVAFSLSFQP